MSSPFALKQKELNEYRRRLQYMVSDEDIRNALGEDTKILKYSQLADYTSMLDLLPRELDFAFVLTETKQNSGHWCCLLRHGKTIEWFDSYGVKPDGELKFVPSFMRKLLGEDTKYLSILIRKLPREYQFEFNKSKLQKFSPNINTCGRWCLLRAEMLKLGYGLDEFVKFIDRNCHAREMPADVLLCTLIPF
jgi:hypothetical protein